MTMATPVQNQNPQAAEDPDPLLAQLVAALRDLPVLAPLPKDDDVPAFPSKLLVRLLTVFCSRRGDLRLILREDRALRRRIQQGASPEWLLTSWRARERRLHHALPSWGLAYAAMRLPISYRGWFVLVSVLLLPVYLVVSSARWLVRRVVARKAGGE
jgi:hypothetical protein